MLATETEHFLRIILLLYQATSFILQCVIKRELKKLGVSLDKLLKKEEFVDNLKHKHHFGLLQLEKLYPSSGKLDIETWDIQMLSVVITMVFRSSISADEKNNVYMIKFVHNNVTNKATASFMEEEYEDIKEDLLEATRGLASDMDISIQKECEKLISSCCSGPLDVHVPQAIQKLEECSDELYQKFDALKKMNKVDALKMKESADKMKQTNDKTDHLNGDLNQYAVQELNGICEDIENMASLVPESNKNSLQELVNDGLNNHTDPHNVCRSKLERKTEEKQVTVIDDEDAEKWLVVEEGEELKENIAEYDLKNIKDVLMKNLKTRKEKPLNITVTGMSEKGKSRLINALRNMEEDEPGEGHDAQKKEVMNTLKEVMGISQEDIDYLYTTFGEKCLVSVEKFFEYKEILEKKTNRKKPGREGAYSPPYAEEHVEASGYQPASRNGCRGGTGRETEVKEVTVIDDKDVEKWLVVEEGEEIIEHFAKYGLKNIEDVLMKYLNRWKEKLLNIAVTGMSGKDKSSFINALRNMEEEEPGAAKVGEEECTTKCRSYPHPEHENFVFWDVPGAGTPTFPKETYHDQIMVDRYDFFLIVYSERFSEIDSCLANKIRKWNKRFYFVRTEIDHDMAYIQRRQKEKFQEKKEFKTLKMTVREKLTKDFGSSQFHFFMISNHHPNKYDFPFLLLQLLNDVPNEKKQAMVFGIAGMSKNIIEEKASALGSRIWKCALMSGAMAAMTNPFETSTFDITIILEEVLFYRDQFALDDDSLRQLAHIANVSLKELQGKVKFKTPEGIFTVGGLTEYMRRFTAGERAEKVAQYTIPVLGISFSCGISFASTMTVLQTILEMMKQDAIDVLVYVSTQETAV